MGSQTLLTITFCLVVACQDSFDASLVSHERGISINQPIVKLAMNGRTNRHMPRARIQMNRARTLGRWVCMQYHVRLAVRAFNFLATVSFVTSQKAITE